MYSNVSLLNTPTETFAAIHMQLQCYQYVSTVPKPNRSQFVSQRCPISGFRNQNQLREANRLIPIPSLVSPQSVIRPSDAARWEHLSLISGPGAHLALLIRSDRRGMRPCRQPRLPRAACLPPCFAVPLGSLSLLNVLTCALVCFLCTITRTLVRAGNEDRVCGHFEIQRSHATTGVAPANAMRGSRWLR